MDRAPLKSNYVPLPRACVPAAQGIHTSTSTVSSQAQAGAISILTSQVHSQVCVHQQPPCSAARSWRPPWSAIQQAVAQHPPTHCQPTHTPEAHAHNPLSCHLHSLSLLPPLTHNHTGTPSPPSSGPGQLTTSRVAGGGGAAQHGPFTLHTH